MVYDPQTGGRIKFRMVFGEYLVPPLNVLSADLWTQVTPDIMAELAEALEVRIWCQSGMFDTQVNGIWIYRNAMLAEPRIVPIFDSTFHIVMWNRDIVNAWGYTWGLKYIARPGF